MVQVMMLNHLADPKPSFLKYCNTYTFSLFSGTDALQFFEKKLSGQWVYWRTSCNEQNRKDKQSAMLKYDFQQLCNQEVAFINCL